ncbi:MAG: FtsX-like permease family protein [Thermoanaerobacterales bacterium]|nr:FtsX-like permease family protein [Thermoanaerobacterales bacterium]
MRTVLIKRLGRTVLQTKGQFAAIVAVVALGLSVYISMTTAYFNLSRSKELFYRENNFADYYFHVVRAPQQVTRRIEAIPGVIKATGRIQQDVPLLKEGDERATARLVAYPPPLASEVNRIHLLSGRMFDENPQNGIEALADPQYAAANRLAPNDTVTIVAEGRRVPLTIVGTATGPEFVYPLKDAASLMPEPKTFGIFMLPLDQAQQILNQPGQVNQIVVDLAPGVDEDDIAARIEALLEPYGNLASYPRREQLSDAVLQGELDGLKTTARTLPAIFLGIAAAIQFVMLGRMIKAQRLSIGVMKALGYASREIMLYYTGYALAVAVTGAVLGTALGLAFASVFSDLYAQFFNLPRAIGGVNGQAILYGFILSLSVGAVAGLSASRGVVKIDPAEAMRPEPPRGGGRVFLERWTGVWRRLDPAWKMSLRTVLRNRVRSAVTLMGVIFAVGLLVIAFFTRDAVDFMLNEHYFREQRYDYLVRFTSPVKQSELRNISRLDGVVKVEPVFEVPVRIHFAGRSEEDLLLGLPRDLTLKELVGENGERLEVPEEGVLLSRRAAEKLGVEPGDRVVVETLLARGPSRRTAVKVVGRNTQLIGSASCVSLAQANRMLREQGLVSGALLKVDSGMSGTVERELNRMTGVSSVLSRQKELAGFNQNLDSLIYSVGIMVAFAAVLGFAIVYNSAAISFAERRRELAALRVLGFSMGEVSSLLLKENVLQTAAGILLGLPFGRLMAEAYMKAAATTDLYTLPVVVYPVTYVLSALGGVTFVMVAHRFAVRGIRRLDLVEALKTKD